MLSLCLVIFSCVVSSCKDPRLHAEWQAEHDLPANLPTTIEISDLDSTEHAVLRCKSDNTTFPLQAVDREKWLFIPTRKIMAGETMQCLAIEAVVKPSLMITEEDGFLVARMDGKELLKYAIDAQLPSDTLPKYYTRSGFIHPLKTYQEKTVTAGFPKGHTHQHGVFHALTRTEIRGKMIDFWNQHAQLGTVRHHAVESIKNGPVFSSFETSLRHIAYFESDTIEPLEEKWTIRILPLQAGYLLDWTSELRCVGPDTIDIPEYHYGGAAFRGCENWNVPGGAYDSLVYFLTNQYKTQADGNHSRPLWATMFGRVPEKFAGVAMMGHPKNFRYPQPIRIHPTMPYFCFAPMVLGQYQIMPGGKYVNRYGIFVYDGRPEADKIQQIHEAFSDL